MSLHSCYLVLHDVLIGDQIDVVCEMHQRYRPMTLQHAEFYHTLSKWQRSSFYRTLLEISIQQRYIHEMGGGSYYPWGLTICLSVNVIRWQLCIVAQRSG